MSISFLICKLWRITSPLDVSQPPSHLFHAFFRCRAAIPRLSARPSPAILSKLHSCFSDRLQAFGGFFSVAQNRNQFAYPNFPIFFRLFFSKLFMCFCILLDSLDRCFFRKQIGLANGADVQPRAFWRDSFFADPQGQTWSSPRLDTKYIQNLLNHKT